MNAVTPTDTTLHAGLTPSPWVTRWTALMRAGGRALDVACGSGRHAHWLAGQGLRVTAVDRDGAALARAAERSPPPPAPAVRWMQADLEAQPWPLGDQHFDVVLLTHYLWRPLWPRLFEALAPGGMYIHETFAHGNATVGKPARPDFLLQPGELLHACRGLRIVAFEDGFCSSPDRYVQRIVAIRESALESSLPPPRYPLDGQASDTAWGTGRESIE